MDKGINIMDETLLNKYLKVIKELDVLMSERAIKSVENKISGYTDKGILMSPENMKNTISLLEKARETNNNISNFGRSVLKVKSPNEEKSNLDAEQLMSRLGRSVCTSEDTAYDRVKNIDNLKKKKNNKNGFFIALEELEKYMEENGIKHAFRCKKKKLSAKVIKEMVDKAQDIDIDDDSEKAKVFKNIAKMEKQNLFDFCDKKPYQCLICPYYYKSFSEFSTVIEKRNEEMRNE